MKFDYDIKNEKINLVECNRTEQFQLKQHLTRFVKDYKYSQPFKMHVWDGKDSMYNSGKIHMGLWKECYSLAKKIDTPFVINNKEDFPLNREVTLEEVTNFCKEFFKYHKIKNTAGEWLPFMPYEHQIEAAYKILRNRYCMCEVATSGGKTLIISIIFFFIMKEKDVKFLIVVPSISLVTQFYDELYQFNYGKNFLEGVDNATDYPDYSPCDIRMTEMMSDKPRIYDGDANIIIGCDASLVECDKHFFKQFHTIACDEAHTVKTDTLNSILKKTFGHAYNRFGVSGTFPNDDTFEILNIQAMLGPCVYKIEASKLVELGIITAMQIKAVLLNYNDKDFGERLKYIRKLGAGDQAYRFELEYVHSSTERTEFIKMIVGKCDNNVLLLFTTIEYGTMMYEKFKAEMPDREFFYIDGQVKNKKREEIKLEMEKNDGKVRVLIASFGTLAVGVSIKNLYYVVFADSYKSEQKIIQSIGRSLRKHGGKEIATIFDIVDIMDSSNPTNSLYRQFLEREKFYMKRKYPYTVTKKNISPNKITTDEN